MGLLIFGAVSVAGLISRRVFPSLDHSCVQLCGWGAVSSQRRQWVTWRRCAWATCGAVWIQRCSVSSGAAAWRRRTGRCGTSTCGRPCRPWRPSESSGSALRRPLPRGTTASRDDALPSLKSGGSVVLDSRKNESSREFVFGSLVGEDGVPRGRAGGHHTGAEVGAVPRVPAATAVEWASAEGGAPLPIDLGDAHSLGVDVRVVHRLRHVCGSLPIETKQGFCNGRRISQRQTTKATQTHTPVTHSRLFWRGTLSSCSSCFTSSAIWAQRSAPRCRHFVAACCTSTGKAVKARSHSPQSRGRCGWQSRQRASPRHAARSSTAPPTRARSQQVLRLAVLGGGARNLSHAAAAGPGQHRRRHDQRRGVNTLGAPLEHNRIAPHRTMSP